MAVIAGFLEKLVPDLMKNVANNGENDSKPWRGGSSAFFKRGFSNP
jgi:hypothetical protein